MFNIFELRKAQKKRESDNIKYYMCGMAYQSNTCNKCCDSCAWKVKKGGIWQGGSR